MRYFLVYIISTLLRYFPFPGKIELIHIGNPNRNSPVLLTGNFKLTIELVKRALRDIDCYLLIANSHGINVWCAATGGHLNNHNVISAIKTSGIEELVDHRHIVLPQLAATGVDHVAIQQKTKWKVIWGPVDANDLPQFLDSGIKKEMRNIHFPFSQRMELAIAWIFTLCVLNTIVFVWGNYLLITSVIIIFPTLVLYLLLPIFINWLVRSPRTGILNPRLIIIQILLFIISLPAVYYVSYKQEINGYWVFIYLFVMCILNTIDLLGTTPQYKSNLHENYLIHLNEEKCYGDGSCISVCPKDCLSLSDSKAELNPQGCVQCGACIVQCPFDALFFTHNDEFIPPTDIRQFKLNMMGGRKVTLENQRDENIFK